jgi:rSAM/selenodomain-associated transferase 2
VKLSIIVPALNEAPRIAQTLAALAPMRARGCEVIVVDGGSSDGTVDAAVAGCDRVIAAPRGRASQQNAGATVATGHVLLFLHADTVLPADADLLVCKAIVDGASWGRFDVRFATPEGGARLPAMLAVVAAMMNARSRWSGIATGDQCLFVTRDAFQRVGGFPAQALMEDIEISRRLKQLGAPACLRQRVTTSPRRWLTRGVWRTIVLMWWLRFAYWLGASPATIARWYR